MLHLQQAWMALCFDCCWPAITPDDQPSRRCVLVLRGMHAPQYHLWSCWVTIVVGGRAGSPMHFVAHRGTGVGGWTLLCSFLFYWWINRSYFFNDVFFLFNCIVIPDLITALRNCSFLLVCSLNLISLICEPLVFDMVRGQIILYHPISSYRNTGS